jgi:hypothetical protein
MQNKLWLILVLAASSAALSGCVPVAFGAAGAVIADKVVEDQKGGEGLF